MSRHDAGHTGTGGGAVYLGARATFTLHPSHEHGYLTISVKTPDGRWDEWNLLMPAIRVPTGAVGTHLGAAEVLEAALSYALRGEPPF